MPAPPMSLQNDTRKLLATGAGLVVAGAVSALLIFTSFGGITRAGWLALMVAIACLPTGTLSLLLGIAKAIGQRRR
jgi:hypothetical protein